MQRQFDESINAFEFEMKLSNIYFKDESQQKRTFYESCQQ